VPKTKEQSLKALYRKMESFEIRDRLKDAELTPLAREAAQNELANRQGTANKKVSEPLSPKVMLRVGAVMLGCAVVFALLAHWLLPEPLFWLVVFSVVPGIAMFIGKAFPGLGLVVGGLLLTTPFWLAVSLWHSGDLKWHGGDYHPIGTMLSYVVLIVGSMAGIGVGVWMLRGVLHEGSWEDLENDANAERNKILDSYSKMD
jgi:hypothetical protein